MTNDVYHAEANRIREAYKLTQIFPPDASALAQYARSFRELNARRDAERLVEPTPTSKL
jgi:hypothetical protein